MNQPVEYKVTKVLNTATAWQTGFLNNSSPSRIQINSSKEMLELWRFVEFLVSLQKNHHISPCEITKNGSSFFPAAA